ncbi:MAG TPA: ABC transporter ATP-binding protein [Casimicrobiaceae bacterium]|jgi:multiple sugar transport system ATP-binding protein
MATVTLSHVGKRYASAQSPAVDDVSFTVGDGEFFVLLGPSGCGKSTTLRMIAGLESITEGTVSIDGKPMNAVAARDRDIAMVFQSYALYPHMTVRDNLAFGLRRRGMPRAEMDRRVEDVASTLGLAPLLHRKPHALSGGQRQRVALGRAIVRQPKVFLFDEPLSNLDAALRVGMRGELGRLHQTVRATMIYVTHDQVEAMTMGDRICIMHDGAVVQIGAPLDVYLRPANTFVATFLGAPPMNLAPVRLSEDRRSLALGETRIPLDVALRDAAARAPSHDVLLGVRPENVAPADVDGIPAQVALVEPLGAETILRLRVPGVDSEMMARMPGVPRLSSGERVRVRFDPHHVHFFDPVSTMRL